MQGPAWARPTAEPVSIPFLSESYDFIEGELEDEQAYTEYMLTSQGHMFGPKVDPPMQQRSPNKRDERSDKSSKRRKIPISSPLVA